jgi:lipocalin
MIKIGFGKRVRPKSFGFIPRFYDPVKEELNERLAKYQETDDVSVQVDQLKSRIKSGLRQKFYGDPNIRSNVERQSNIRLLFIIITLFLISYVILKSDRFLSMLDVFTQ